MKREGRTKRIDHTVVLRASPKHVFEALMDSERRSGFTGEPAAIDPRRGGIFTCYGTYITGITLEFERNKRIVQAWRTRNWPSGLYSIVTFELKAKGRTKTELRFSQVGVPADDYAAKNKGWKTHYWEPLQLYLNGRSR